MSDQTWALILTFTGGVMMGFIWCYLQFFLPENARLRKAVRLLYDAEFRNIMGGR